MTRGRWGGSAILRKILVPVRGDGMSEIVLLHAAVLARRHNAHIVVAHCRNKPGDFMPYSRPLRSFVRDTVLEQVNQLADQEERQLRADLHEMAEKFGLTETATPEGPEATIAFVEEFGHMADMVKHHGRLADLIVVPKPARDRNLGMNSLKSALFRTGRPVLMCPREGGVAFEAGARIAVGWNGSLESARAVAVTLDLAARADAVTILSAGQGEPHGASTDELVEYYRLRGVTATATTFEGRNAGKALLAKSAEIGATMLIMGAYGHSHEHETLFGGNTQAVVDAAEIPVVFAH
ncbi:MAG: universal stress protein [Pseudomonadota bacterium]